MTDVVGNPEEERRAEFYYQPWAQEAVCRYFYSKVIPQFFFPHDFFSSFEVMQAAPFSHRTFTSLFGQTALTYQKILPHTSRGHDMKNLNLKGWFATSSEILVISVAFLTRCGAQTCVLCLPGPAEAPGAGASPRHQEHLSGLQKDPVLVKTNAAYAMFRVNFSVFWQVYRDIDSEQLCHYTWFSTI